MKNKKSAVCFTLRKTFIGLPFCDVGREEQHQPPVASPRTAARRFEHGTLKRNCDSPGSPCCARLSACSLLLDDGFCFPVRLCLRYPSPPSFFQLMGFLSTVYILNPWNMNHAYGGRRCLWQRLSRFSGTWAAPTMSIISFFLLHLVPTPRPFIYTA